MKRLLWKEFHEQVWMFASAVAAPVLVLMFSRMVLRRDYWWPTGVESLWLVYVVFAFWGASRMPHERESSRLTLAALPVRLWQVWLLKALPGLIGAVIAAHVVHFLGQGPPSNMRPFSLGGAPIPQLSSWLMSGEMASAYCIAFLASLFWGVGVSAVISGIASTVGWGMYWSGIHAARTADVSWLLAATLLAVSACVMLARSRGASSRRAGIVTAAVCVTIVGVALVPGWIGEWGNPSIEYVPYGYRGGGEPLVSQDARLVALPQRSSDDRQPGAQATRLLVFGLDGSGRREIARATGLVPLAWSSRGELLFLRWDVHPRLLSVTTSKERRRLAGAPLLEVRLWDRRTGKSRVLEKWPARHVRYPWRFRASFEPRGSRVAILQPSVGIVSRMNEDLWLLDTRTGRKRLLWPETAVAVSALWRGGWIELHGYRGGVRYVPPGGGRPREDREIRAGGGSAL